MPLTALEDLEVVCLGDLEDFDDFELVLTFDFDVEAVEEFAVDFVVLLLGLLEADTNASESSESEDKLETEEEVTLF